MSRTDPQVNFRMPAKLKQKLEQAAARNHRSITAELIARLEESFLMEGDDDLYELTTDISKKKLMAAAEEEKIYSASDFHDVVEAAFKLLGARITPEKVREMKAKRAIKKT